MKHIHLKNIAKLILIVGIAQFVVVQAVSAVWHRKLVKQPITLSQQGPILQQTLKPWVSTLYKLEMNYAINDTHIDQTFDPSMNVMWMVSDESGKAVAEGRRMGLKACGWSVNDTDICLGEFNLEAGQTYHVEVSAFGVSEMPKVSKSISLGVHHAKLKDIYFWGAASNVLLALFGVLGFLLLFIHKIWMRKKPLPQTFATY